MKRHRIRMRHWLTSAVAFATPLALASGASAMRAVDGASVRHSLLIILFGFISLLPFETGRSSGRALTNDPVRPSRLPRPRVVPMIRHNN